MEAVKLTFAQNNSNAKKRKKIKRKERKFKLLSNEPVCRPPEIFKNALSLKGQVVCQIPKLKSKKCFYYKSTNAYSNVIAKPAFLASTPKIFQISNPKNGVLNSSDSFLHNFLSGKSFNTDVNERFIQEFINNNNRNEKKKEKVRDDSQDNNGLHEETENINSVDIYKVSQNKGLIFHMHHPIKFSFHGEIKITVIRGEIEVLGFTLSSSGKNSAEIFSPNFCSSLTIETKPVKTNNLIEEEQSKLKDLINEDDYHSILTNLRSEDSVVLLIEKHISNFGIVINKYFDKPLFPKDLEDVSSQTETLKSLQSSFTFQLPKKGKYFRKSPQWDRIPLGQCTALCGGKGVGKSSLLKYYINKLVTLGEKVLCLDFDPGQPEFTIPGCVSAIVIDQPLLGPSFTHILDPIVMISFGSVEVSSNPSKYLECVKYIIESCRKNEDLLKLKCFVNTMGFCKGLGISLMITILKLLKPNTVIQIKSSDYKNNYPFYLTPVTLNSKSGFWTMPLKNVNLSYDLRLIYTCAESERKQLQGGLKPRQLRDIMYIAYFSKMLSHPFYNFNAVQPFLISFSKLYLGIDFLIEPNNVLKAFNGNTVSLSHFEPENEEIFSFECEEDDYFDIVVKPNIAPSLGIGFVRGIDCKEKKFYILTHLPTDTLNRVNCLSLGRISPPHSIFLKQEAVEGQIVYTTPGTVDIIKRVKRIFRVPETSQKKENRSP